MDTPAHWGSLLLFCFAMTATPGPNNLMLTASGARFGFWRTAPHIVGIIVGFTVLLMAVAGGLGAIFVRWPVVHDLLKLAGISVLLWLGWRMATAPLGLSLQEADSLRPFRIDQGALFQFINPKAWLMTTSAVTTFSQTGSEFWPSVGWMVVAWVLVSLVALPMWAGFGTLLARRLQTDRSQQVFNGGMGLLTGLSAITLVF